MQKTFIGILIIILGVVLFALNNSTTVIIDFWIWNVESNLSLVLILTVIFGAFSSFLLSLPYRTKKNHEIMDRDKRIKILEDEIRHLNKDKTYSVKNEK
jgi:lipopolysaccharide assembly protein A